MHNNLLNLPNCIFWEIWLCISKTTFYNAKRKWGDSAVLSCANKKA